MKRKKMMSVLLAAAMLAASVVGCGSSSGTESSSGAASTGTAAETTAETVQSDTAAQTEASTEESQAGTGGSYTMFIRSQYHDWIEELNWYDVAEERTGITVEYVDGPEEIADTYNEVDQRLASGTLPDATMCKLSQAKVYGSQGAFVDLAPYLEEYAPNYLAYIEANPQYKAYVTDENGAIYGLVKESPIFADLIGYRADHFEKAGIDPAFVKTIDDFTEALRTLKAYYGADNPNYYPLSGRESALRFASWFGAAAYVDEDSSGGIYYGHEKDNCFDIKAEGAYRWIETMKTWYDEGLINPSWVEGTNGEGDWESQTIEGNASVFYDYYNRAEWFMSNGGPDVDPDYDMQVLDFLQDENGNTIPVPTSVLLNGDNCIAVSSACDEETIATILRFTDYFYTEEGIDLANWGVEGESYQVNSDGTKEYIVDYTEEENKPAGEKKWSFLSDRLTVCKPVDQTAFYTWNTDLIAEAANRCFVEENLLERPIVVYTTEQEEQLSNLVAAVYDSETAGLTGFIVGNTELNEENWNAFIEQMDSLGLSQIEQIQLEAYQNTIG